MIHTPRLHLGSVPRSLAALAAAVLLFSLVPLAGTAFARDGEIVVNAGDGLVPSVRYAGEDRFDTSELIATDPTEFRATFSGEAVILARADAFPDALAGSTLAGLADAPIVLTPADTAADEGDLNEDTAEALDAYDPSTIYILGGPEAIGTDVEDEVANDYPDAEVIRIGGENRFETAALIADQAESATAAAETATAIVARGGDFADALVAGSIAAAAELPLLLTGSEGTLDPYAADRLEDLGIERVLLAGGPAAISTDIEDEIAEIVDEVDRIAGEERLATAAAFAELAVTEFGFSTTHVNLAFGFNFPDALALGAHAGLDFAGPSPILLTEGDGLGDATAGFLSAIASPDFAALHLAGGFEALPESVEDEARAILTAEDEPSTLTLTPETATNLVNESHTVTATVLHNGLAGVADTDVTFSMTSTGATGVPTEVTATTDADGVATASFTSSTPGVVDITATVAGSDDEDLTATAQKTFVLPTVSAYGFDTVSSTLITFDALTGEGADEPGVPVGGDFNAATGVVGLDVRPATGQLYALGSDGQLYTVDTATGDATAVGTPIVPADAAFDASAGAAFDFNPVIDRIRVVLPDDTNLVVNPDTGAIQAEQADVVYAPGDTNETADPTVTAAAYSNAVAGETATATTLYDIDSALDVLATQSAAPPAAGEPSTVGQLTTVGDLGVDAPDLNGFDIYSLAGGRNVGVAALADGGNTDVVTVDLATGAGTVVHTLTGANLSAFALAQQEFTGTFTVALSAENEEPTPNETGAFGVADVSLDAVTGLVCSMISVDKGEATGTFEGSPGAHIHEAGPDEVGPVVVPLTPPDDETGMGAGCTFTDPALAAEIAANPGNYYVNVHTTDFPAGLVRGQLDNDNDGDGSADS